MKLVILIPFVLSASLMSMSGYGFAPEDPSSTVKKSANILGLDFVGASNTNGTGASLPIEIRYEKHLNDHPGVKEAILEKLASKNALVAIDYFFPTRFRELNESSVNLEEKVEDVFSKWLKKYQTIFVGVLPTKTELSPFALEWIDRNPESSAANIVREVSGETLDRANKVNSLIRNFASRNPKQVRILKTTELIEQWAKQSSSHNPLSDFSAWLPNIIGGSADGVIPSVDDSFVDKVHFSDKGQAFYFNAVLKPAFEEFWNVVIPSIETKNLSQEEGIAIYGEFLDDPSGFVNRQAGTYWASLADSEQLKNPEFHRAEGSSSEWSKEGRNRLTVIKDIIAKQSGEISGFPIIVPKDAVRGRIGLQLSQVLFYTLIYLEGEPPSSWGYDYWFSYTWNAGSATIPGTNYYFELRKSPEDPLALSLKWLIYPTVEFSDGKVQEDHRDRQPYPDEGVPEEINGNPGKYPYLEYNLSLRIGSPS